jgi:8-oxo-dGTP diphosphatase
MTTSRSTRNTARKFSHIAVGVLINDRGEVLICQRPPHKLYPGEWEFPGGKVEAGENVEVALRRELDEELGIRVTAARPLICLRYVYPELSVELDTWLVTGYAGTPRSTEHPASQWVAPSELPRWRLLAADRPIVNALRLPWHCVFTPPELEVPQLLAAAAQLPPSLLRLRLPGWDAARYREHARASAAALAGVGVQLVLDRDPADVDALGARGFHASTAALQGLRRRPVAAEHWFGASCHNAEEIAVARAFGADYVVVGPVKQTPTHPRAMPLGWEGFAALARCAGLPAYAIGGVGPEDLPDAWRHGAQGVAGISAYWRGS